MLEKMIEPDFISDENGKFYSILTDSMASEVDAINKYANSLKDYIVPCKEAKMGENTVLEYFGENMQPLSEYIKNNHLKARDYKNMLLSIDKLRLKLKDASISENSINLDPKTIFVDNNNTLHFSIVPNGKKDFYYELSKFLIRVLRYCDVNDKTALNLAYCLFVRSSKENYKFNELKEILDYTKINDKSCSISFYKDLDNEKYKSASDIQEKYSKTGIVYDKNGFLPKNSNKKGKSLNV